jgi:hypothetical protein
MILQNLIHEPPYPPSGTPFFLILAREEGEQGEEEEGISGLRHIVESGVYSLGSFLFDNLLRSI